MKHLLWFLIALFAVYMASTGYKASRHAVAKSIPLKKMDAPSSPTLYDSLNLKQTGLSESVFGYALRGWRKTDTTKTILTIADLSQPSSQKRLYVIDLQRRKLLFNTYVAHGRNSGDLVPDRFSNVPSSLQSSLGFYQTLNTYMGRHGLSLQLKGLEKGFNDNVYNRNIVLHGAPYVCEDTIRIRGRLGCSEGCPAVPYADSKGIIKVVKGGSCLFVYAPNPNYLTKSAYLTNP